MKRKEGGEPIDVSLICFDSDAFKADWIVFVRYHLF